MADLIDRAELISEIENRIQLSGERFNLAWRIESKVVGLIKNAPAVDAVEVVRCKDCKHWDEIKHGCGWCCATTPSHVWTNDDEYCRRGERKEI